MDKLSTHAKLSEAERTQHIDLSSPCEFSGPRGLISRRRFAKHKLLVFHNLVEDLWSWRNWNGQNLCVRHHCENDSVRGCCVNPLHLSVGTDFENAQDIPVEVRIKRASKAGTAASKLKTGIHAVWVSTLDGFHGNSGNVAKHNRHIGGTGLERVKLEPEEAAFVFAWGS